MEEVAKAAAGGGGIDAPCPKAKDGGAFGTVAVLPLNDDRIAGPDESKGCSSNESSPMVARRGYARRGDDLWNCCNGIREANEGGRG